MTMQPTPELLLAIASGIVLSAACGLRAFLPPFVVGIAARLGWIPLEPSVRWLEATPTMGHANPLLSTAEDATALGLVVTAILVPLLALALVIVLIVALARRRRTARVATPGSAAPEH